MSIFENKYYSRQTAQDLTDPEEAIAEFLGMPALEQERSEWGFKGLEAGRSSSSSSSVDTTTWVLEGSHDILPTNVSRLPKF